MPASHRIGLSIPLPLKIIESAALNTKLPDRINRPAHTFRPQRPPKLSQPQRLAAKSVLTHGEENRPLRG